MDAQFSDPREPREPLPAHRPRGREDEDPLRDAAFHRRLHRRLHAHDGHGELRAQALQRHDGVDEIAIRQPPADHRVGVDRQESRLDADAAGAEGMLRGPSNPLPVGSRVETAEYAVDVTECTPDGRPRRARVRLQPGEARWLVGCDGANSAVLVRESSSGAELRIALPQTGAYADLAVGETVHVACAADQALAYKAVA